MKRKNTTGIPDFEIASLARVLLPAIQKFYQSERNNAEFKLWQAENKKQKNGVRFVQGELETTLSGVVSIIHPMVCGDDYISIEKQRKEIDKLCKKEDLCVLKEYITDTNLFENLGEQIREYLSEVDFCKTIVLPIEPSIGNNKTLIEALRSVLKKDDIIIKPFYIME